jgi:EAL domain-containing protein (putative c-di-GMP-specific phosphodiesterase class I)
MIDVSAGNLAAHVNADHFIIFLNTKDNQTIVRTLKDISLSLSLISAEMSVPQIRPYFGVSSWHTNKKIEQSYNEAIIAKHKAKEQQNSDYAFFNEEDTMRTIRDKKMTDSFEDALARKEFKLWFQPKYNPITKKLVGAEALVRWYTPDGAIIQPGDFIPLFEKSNLIRQLDEYIFRNLCLILSGWQRAGKNIVPISVNLSRNRLDDKNLIDNLVSIVDQYRVDHKLIDFELTESASYDNMENMINVLQELRKRGFKISMDDFGTGYSSLSLLTKMPIDTLKIDKSFVDNVATENERKEDIILI